MTTPEAVASWMLDELRNQNGVLYQEDAAYKIAARFGDEFTYLNTGGGLAIRRDVLEEFKRLTGETVVWSRGEKMWRRREAFDTPGRRQSDD